MYGGIGIGVSRRDPSAARSRRVETRSRARGARGGRRGGRKKKTTARARGALGCSFRTAWLVTNWARGGEGAHLRGVEAQAVGGRRVHVAESSVHLRAPVRVDAVHDHVELLHAVEERPALHLFARAALQELLRGFVKIRTGELRLDVRHLDVRRRVRGRGRSHLHELVQARSGVERREGRARASRLRGRHPGRARCRCRRSAGSTLGARKKTSAARRFRKTRLERHSRTFAGDAGWDFALATRPMSPRGARARVSGIRRSPARAIRRSSRSGEKTDALTSPFFFLARQSGKAAEGTDERRARPRVRPDRDSPRDLCLDARGDRRVRGVLGARRCATPPTIALAEKRARPSPSSTRVEFYTRRAPTAAAAISQIVTVSPYDRDGSKPPRRPRRAKRRVANPRVGRFRKSARDLTQRSRSLNRAFQTDNFGAEAEISKWQPRLPAHSVTRN